MNFRNKTWRLSKASFSSNSLLVLLYIPSFFDAPSLNGDLGVETILNFPVSNRISLKEVLSRQGIRFMGAKY